MSPDKAKALCEKYPLIFANKPRFDCGDGWYFLIDALCERLQNLTKCNPRHKSFQQIIATQVKEKFGGLRFYVQSSSEQQDGMIGMVEALSYSTCDVCGMPGRPNTDGWIRTRCEEHINEL